MAIRDQLSGSDSLAPGRQSDPWNAFGRGLSRLLRDPTAVGALEFSAPGNGTDGQDRCLLQRAGDESAWVSLRPGGETLIEEMIVWNDRSEPDELARAVMEACRDRLGVPHPQLLTLRGEGPLGRRTGPLRLVRTDSVPVGQDPADDPSPVDVAVEVSDHEDARDRYEVLVERVTGHPCVVDDDGHLVFDHVGHQIHIEFREDLPYANIRAWVARGVRSRAEAALEVARLNLADPHTTWVLDGRHVLQRTTVPVSPFLPRHAQGALEHFLYTFACTRDQIAHKLGPR